ncbi:MAG: hypothetical protein HGA61_03585 [Candidatus Moranbacteria bacterium]|nr:hypothetical protein [Candidatus Moranbacteria bacterium]
MSLEDLNKNLHNMGGGETHLHSHEKSQYDPTFVSASVSPFDEKMEWEKARREMNPFQKRVLKISVIVLLVIVLVVSGFVFSAWWQKNAFHQDRVSISFEGPKEADSTQVVKYIIHYRNDNPVKLRDAEVQLSYSENFQPTDNVNLKYLNSTNSRIFIGDIPSKGEGTVEVKGIFYAPKDFPVYLHGLIKFVPSNGKTEFSVGTQTSVNITTSPVILNVSAPTQATDGDSVEYVVDYKNLDIRRLNNVQIRMEFPMGFQIVQAQPESSQDDSYWTLGDLDSNQGGKIKIRGTIQGANNENKNIVVSLGRLGADGQFSIYNKREVGIQIVLPALSVRQKVDGIKDGVVSAGDNLRYTINYQNTGTSGLRDAIVSVEIQGKILDFAKINSGGGYFDGGKNTIIWKASEVPALANINPNTTGELNFSIPVKTIIPVINKNDKNFVVRTVARIDSPDIPTPIDSNKIIGSNVLELKLSSKVILDTKGYFNDAKIKNSGPIPIRVGAETLFAMHWSLVNISNDLTDCKVVSSLPAGVRWTGLVYPENEYVSYDARTNQITWSIGNMVAGLGTLSPPKEVEFQVGVTPQINQVGEMLKLVNESFFSGTDIFTGKEITVQNGAKDTQLIEDPGVKYEGGKVVK